MGATVKIVSYLAHGSEFHGETGIIGVVAQINER